jgi:hypothetical protein
MMVGGFWAVSAFVKASQRNGMADNREAAMESFKVALAD